VICPLVADPLFSRYLQTRSKERPATTMRGLLVPLTHTALLAEHISPAVCSFTGPWVDFTTLTPLHWGTANLITRFSAAIASAAKRPQSCSVHGAETHNNPSQTASATTPLRSLNTTRIGLRVDLPDQQKQRLN